MGKEQEPKKEKEPKKQKEAKRETPAKAAADAKAPKERGGEEKGAPPRLHSRYTSDVVPALMKRFHYQSVMQVPRLEKIAVNVGVGQATQDPKLLDAAAKELEAITGQKVAITKSKKAISNFKLRENLPIGCRVTLRRARMYEFMDRFITIALPRVRDFRGVSDKSFDGHGNFTIGVKEQIIFPEVDVDKITRITGMDITFVTTARTDPEAYELLKEMGMPFMKREEVVQKPALAKSS